MSVVCGVFDSKADLIVEQTIGRLLVPPPPPPPFTFTLTFSHLADALIQSELQNMFKLF